MNFALKSEKYCGCLDEYGWDFWYNYIEDIVEELLERLKMNTI
jgi:hypothetical protein